MLYLYRSYCLKEGGIWSGTFKVVDGDETTKDREFIDGTKEGRKGRGGETDVTTQHLKGVVREGGLLKHEIRSEGA